MRVGECMYSVGINIDLFHSEQARSHDENEVMETHVITTSVIVVVVVQHGFGFVHETVHFDCLLN